jgi:hypothetical protein
MKLKWGRAPGRMTNGRMTMMSGHCRGGERRRCDSLVLGMALIGLGTAVQVV